MGAKMSLWDQVQFQPELFSRGGAYFEQVTRKFGSLLQQGTHIDFKEFPGMTFVYNAHTYSLEICLGKACMHAYVVVSGPSDSYLKGGSFPFFSICFG